MKAAESFIARAMNTGLFEDEEQCKMLPFVKSHYNFCMLPQLTIGIMNGSVMGQGLGYVCSCDIVLAPKSAFFSLTDVKIGLMPALMAPYLLLKCSNNMAKKKMMMGETFNAEDAKEKGFVQYIFEDMAEAQNLLKEICGRITESSPEAITQAKRLSYGVAGRPVTEGVMWYTLKYLNQSISSSFKKGEEKPWKGSPIEPVEPAPFA